MLYSDADIKYQRKSGTRLQVERFELQRAPSRPGGCEKRLPKPTFSRVSLAVPRTQAISTRFRALLASLDAASREEVERRHKASEPHREQAARDESPSAASRLRHVRHVLGRVRRATGVAPGRPQGPQGVGARGARAAPRRRAPRTGPTAGRVSRRAHAAWRSPPGRPRAPNRGATRDRRRPGLRRPPRGAAPRRGRFRRRAPRPTSSSRATARRRPTRRRRPGAPDAVRHREGLRRARSPPAEPRRAEKVLRAPRRPLRRDLRAR